MRSATDLLREIAIALDGRYTEWTNFKPEELPQRARDLRREYSDLYVANAALEATVERLETELAEARGEA